MTTPAGIISMHDIRVETGAGTPVSFDQWFVRHVAKQATGPISMSSMRGKTCQPRNMLGMTYVGSEIFAYYHDQPNSASAYWADFVGSGVAAVYNYTDWSIGIPKAYTIQGGQVFIDFVFNGRAIRVFRGSYRQDDPANASVKLYATRWVEG
jgi:hypothetical protein